jgi:hypothetical protein
MEIVMEPRTLNDLAGNVAVLDVVRSWFRVSQICLSASCLSVSLRLYFLEGTGRRRCFLPSASKSQI